MRPKVTVLLAAHNGANFINRQIDSILSQIDVDVKIIVSDDCSSDETRSILNDYKDRDNIRVIFAKKATGGAAQNFFSMLPLITRDCEYVALADQDDLWSGDKLIRAISCLSGGYDAYSSSFIAFWQNGKFERHNKAQKQVKYDHFFESPGPGCTFLMRAPVLISVWEDFLNKNEQLSSIKFHDWLLYAAFRERGYKWFIDRSYPILYRQHQSNVFGANSGYKGFAHRVNLVTSGFAIKQAMAIADLAKTNSTKKSLVFYIFRFYSCRRSFKDKIYFLLAMLPSIVRFGPFIAI